MHAYMTTHIRRTPNSALAPDAAMSGDGLKDTLKKAIVHYHPDKQVHFDKKWQVHA